MYLIDPIILKRDKFDEGGILELKKKKIQIEETP